jgi:tetratricopeptide (TPR) repeat protein
LPPQRNHKAAVSSQSCVACHMPQVRTSPTLEFTNQWIGVYEQTGPKLVPSRRIAKGLEPAPTDARSSSITVPADPATLVVVYEQALARREAETEPNSPKVARAAANLGSFLAQIGDLSAAEAPLRRALSIDVRNSDRAVDRDRERLAAVLTSDASRGEAIRLLLASASAQDRSIAIRSYASLAKLDPEQGDSYYRNAITVAERAPLALKIAVLPYCCTGTL